MKFLFSLSKNAQMIKLNKYRIMENKPHDRAEQHDRRQLHGSCLCSSMACQRTQRFREWLELVRILVMPLSHPDTICTNRMYEHWILWMMIICQFTFGYRRKSLTVSREQRFRFVPRFIGLSSEEAWRLSSACPCWEISAAILVASIGAGPCRINNEGKDSTVA